MINSINYIRLAKILSEAEKPLTFDKIRERWDDKYAMIPIEDGSLKRILYALKKDGNVKSKRATFYKMPDEVTFSDILTGNEHAQKYI